MIKSLLIFLLLLGGAYALLLAFTCVPRFFLPKQKAEAAAFWIPGPRSWRSESFGWEALRPLTCLVAVSDHAIAPLLRAAGRRDARQRAFATGPGGCRRLRSMAP